MAVYLFFFSPQLSLNGKELGHNRVSCSGRSIERSMVAGRQNVGSFHLNNALQRDVCAPYWLNSSGWMRNNASLVRVGVGRWTGCHFRGIYAHSRCLCRRTCASIVFWVIYKHHCLMLLCIEHFCFIFCSHSWILLLKRRTTHPKSLAAFQWLQKDVLFQRPQNAILQIRV